MKLNGLKLSGLAGLLLFAASLVSSQGAWGADAATSDDSSSSLTVPTPFVFTPKTPLSPDMSGGSSSAATSETVEEINADAMLPTGNLNLATGYRKGYFHRGIAGDPTGHNPTIASESTWKNVDVYEIRANSEIIVEKTYVFKLAANYGWIFGGEVLNSEYAADARMGEFSTIQGKSGGDNLLDTSAGMGYRLKPSSDLTITPFVGYSFHEQNLTSDNNIAALGSGTEIRGPHSSYKATWKGPWVGGDLNYRPWRNWILKGTGEYHWGDYVGKGDWYMQDDYAHPISLKETSSAQGVIGSGLLEYAYNRQWSVNLMMEYQTWWTPSGNSERNFSDGTTEDTYLTQAEWQSFAVTLGMTYYFDPGNSFYEPLAFDKKPAKAASLVKISGRYRVAAGMNSFGETILNDANADMQERNWRFLFGERLNNTYDKAIFSQYLLNVDYEPVDRVNIFSQIVADPWSLVGTTGDQFSQSVTSGGGITYTEAIKYKLKYFGAFNSTINEGYRANNGDSLNIPVIKVHDGHTTFQTVKGFDWGQTLAIPEAEIDYEFRPIRKLWMDYTQDEWHARAFALADEAQALTTDDPIGLSNHRDYWQQSPWLNQYLPVQFFTDGSLKRGYYSDSVPFLARDSDGNRLVLLRGASYEASFDHTYLAATVASPITPWDDRYFSANNVPGAFRVKHWTTDKLMIGGTYTFRTGLIDESVADFDQAGGVDLKYRANENVSMVAAAAVSRRRQDLLTNEAIIGEKQGYAYKFALTADFDHRLDGHSNFLLGFTQMDKDFDTPLSRFTNTRDDRFWGQHLSFDEIPPGLDHFRLGDGIDANRFVFRFQWKEKMFKDRFFNLFDVRNVHKTENSAYKETVLRDEVTIKLNSRWTAKGLFRWQGLPKTTPYIEPFIANFYVADVVDPEFQNLAVPADKDPSRFTYAGGLQYIINKKWTAEGMYEFSNNIPDFPRGLMNSTFRDANDRVDGLLIDHITNLLYGQAAVGAVPPYKYHSLVKERLIFKPEPGLKFVFHAAQNGYKYSAGIDDNMNHEGLSVEYTGLQKWTLFADYTFSQLIDLPKLIATDYMESDYRGHHNFYTSADYRISAKTIFRAEYGVFGMGSNTPLVGPYSTTSFSLPTIDTEHLLRVSLTGDF